MSRQKMVTFGDGLMLFSITGKIAFHYPWIKDRDQHKQWKQEDKKETGKTLTVSHSSGHPNRPVKAQMLSVLQLVQHPWFLWEPRWCWGRKMLLSQICAQNGIGTWLVHPGSSVVPPLYWYPWSSLRSVKNTSMCVKEEILFKMRFKN